MPRPFQLLAHGRIFIDDISIYSSSRLFPLLVEQGCTSLEQRLVVPVRVDLCELGDDPVVLAHEQGVDHRQHGLLVHPTQKYIIRRTLTNFLFGKKI
jgi:hypothetical protein